MGNPTGQKDPCPQCRESGQDTSGDNLIRYEDGSGYCFACDYSEQGTVTSTQSESSPSRGSKSKLLSDVEIVPLISRKISEETCRHFGYGVTKFKGRNVQVAPYMRDGKVVAQKIRDAKKNFMFLGAPREAGLFGQHLWRDGGKQLVITEGEIDAMSFSQLQNNQWPVVSVPNGAAGADKTIRKEIEWIEKFDRVVFMFDMDEPGQKAAKKCAALLSPGKAFIARVPGKDPNEALVAGRHKELINCMWGATAFRPDGVIDIAEVADEACKDIEIGKPWPWPTLTEKTYGRRRKEVYGLGGGTGCGKSTVFKQVATHILEVDKLPVGMLMLEEPAATTAKTMAGMLMGVRVHVPGVTYSKKQLKETLVGLKGQVFLYDHFGSMDWGIIKSRIRYMVLGCGVKDIFLDHLTALAACIETDERKAIDRIMAELAALSQELDCTIYYISHLTTPEGKSHEEGGRVLEKQFRGSRSIAYWSHFIFGIERDKQDPDGVIVFRCLKDRYTGDASGLTIGLKYDQETGRLSECPIPDRGSGSAESHGFTDEY